MQDYSRSLAGSWERGAARPGGAFSQHPIRPVATASPSAIAQAGRVYFASDRARGIQSVLGLVWLLDGALQLQPFMYSSGFAHMLIQTAQGQPPWLSASMRWAAGVELSAPVLFNTLFALTQLAIGAGILCRRTVKPALALSFMWALVVWWIGEGFGMLFAGAAQPLTGAPGGVLIYVMVGVVVWPNGQAGGLLGPAGARRLWCGLWLLLAGLWLLAPSSAPGEFATMLRSTPSGIAPLSSAQDALASTFAGSGLAVALACALLSAVTAFAPLAPQRWRAALMWLSVALNGAFWVFGQSLGGIFAGRGTDPGTAPLIILLATAVWPLILAATPALKPGQT